MDHWSKRLWRALEWKGWSQRELARRADIHEQKVYKYLQGRVDQPRGDTMLRLADTLGVTESWLRFEVGPAVENIPVIGRIAAGENFIPFDDTPGVSNYAELPFNLDAADPIAVEVRGESMLPVYRPGDYLVCSRRRGREMETCLNKDCVVKTDQGEGYVKKLVSGSNPGTYTLISYNSPSIENIRLLWAAPIIWVKRG
jgi:phage repressor protein C with HTH and peptisase S24 domain|tara:strand:- start:1199 stop:1795 length:597 start_codon:yes stop_codon:yes gene_type:complete